MSFSSKKWTQGPGLFLSSLQAVFYIRPVQYLNLRPLLDDASRFNPYVWALRKKGDHQGEASVSFVPSLFQAGLEALAEL